MPVIEQDIECKSCQGTGLYVGLAERDGSAVVCHTCEGEGHYLFRLEYSEFTKRKKRACVQQVFEVNPGICIGVGGDQQFRLSDFGGMPYQEWLNGRAFRPGMENRRFTCPAWWYQTADYDKKPKWDECAGAGSFSACERFPNKGECWRRWDRENP